ncbi:hypothetical protein RRG08_040035 [Elysia crispata]|uniref:Uncharacterized protein n=1 Tax=Elysia crispata TaxID=231223 RepID=A0AAE0Z7W5_9GAST|nr:hypothetical protein RRG08_040035 [Elysia crispata]
MARPSFFNITWFLLPFVYVDFVELCMVKLKYMTEKTPQNSYPCFPPKKKSAPKRCRVPDRQRQKAKTVVASYKLFRNGTLQGLAVCKQAFQSVLSKASHYDRRERPNRRYLPSNLSISKMHHLFRAQNHIQVSFALYYSMFETDFNLGFGHPATDVCSTCIAYKAKIRSPELDDEQKRQECAMFILHRLSVKVSFTFLVPGHSFVPADRVFGRIERDICRQETILMPADYHEILQRHGTVHVYQKDWTALDFKPTVLPPTSTVTETKRKDVLNLLSVISAPTDVQEYCESALLIGEAPGSQDDEDDL